MEKRYQVFISSTYEDLKEERKSIIEILLNAKFVPAGMEMFAASNEEQFKYIKKIIDNCDYYVLILGARYGSINLTSGKSFTEMEYDYAIEQKIPILAFVHSDPENINANKREKENVDLFNKFRIKVLKNSKMCKMWTEQSDLVANVLVSLVQIVDECPRIGWSRGEQDITELLTQINQLRIENNELRNQNMDLLHKTNTYLDEQDELSRGNDSFILEGISYDVEMKMDLDIDEYLPVWVNEEKCDCTVTWNELLKAVAPGCFSGCKDYEFKDLINEFCQEVLGIEHFNISRKSYNIIKFQMLALNWIEMLETNFQDDSIIISLSDEGKREFLNAITIKR